MVFLTGNLVSQPDAGSDQLTLIISQTTGEIVHVSDLCGDLLKVGSSNLKGRDIREVFPVALPPRLNGLPRAHNRLWDDGSWINFTTVPGSCGLRELQLTWRTIPLGWINYWLLTIREPDSPAEDSLTSDMLDKTDFPLNPSFRLVRNGQMSTDNWQLMSFHRATGVHGGDVLFIDELSPGYLMYFLGDVAGHDRSAEVVRLMLTTYLKVYREEFIGGKPESFPGLLLSRINDALVLDEHNDCLLTANVIILEKHGSRMWFSSAGHQPALLVNPCGSETRLTSPDIPLGIREGVRYASVEMICGPGDRLLCYTDGLITSGPESRHRLGMSELRSIFTKNSSAPLSDLAGRIQDLWRKSRNDSAFREEDITFSVISRKSPMKGLEHRSAMVN